MYLVLKLVLGGAYLVLVLGDGYLEFILVLALRDVPSPSLSVSMHP